MEEPAIIIDVLLIFLKTHYVPSENVIYTAAAPSLERKNPQSFYNSTREQLNWLRASDFGGTVHVYTVCRPLLQYEVPPTAV